MWDYPVALEFTFFRVKTVEGYLHQAGFTIDEVLERDPYAPDVEFQSRRAYVLAYKPETNPKFA